MSLGGGNSPTLDLAVNAAVDAGIHFAVAAGNERSKMLVTLLQPLPPILSLLVPLLADDRAYFSNWGKVCYCCSWF